MPDQPDQTDTHQPDAQGDGRGVGQQLPSQESVDLLTRLLLDLDRRSETRLTTLRQKTDKDIEAVLAVLNAIETALALGDGPITISGVTPARGAARGGEPVTITGSQFLGVKTVRFGDSDAKTVSVISPTEIRATTPPAPPGTAGTAGALDVAVVVVVADGLVGAATRAGAKAGGFTYQY